MGKNSRLRRNKKLKKKAAAQKTRRREEPAKNDSSCDCGYCETNEPDNYNSPIDMPFDDPNFVRSLISSTAQALTEGDEYNFYEMIGVLVTVEKDVTVSILEEILLNVISAVWEQGWQPPEISRRTRRKISAIGERLISTLIAADHSQRPKESIHPQWAARIGELDLNLQIRRSGWLKDFRKSESLDWTNLIELCIRVFAMAATSGDLHILIPPPGSHKATESIIDLTEEVSDPVLKKVRALLIQAESTNFEAEAETFMAKAHGLMARHSINKAMLFSSQDKKQHPITIRVPIDEPYVDPKASLLHFVSINYRCQAIFDETNAISTLVGFPSDITATELMFTSLLVQAQKGLQETAKKAHPDSKPRSRNFRSAFLIGFADRINSRLSDIGETIISDLDDSYEGSLLPVLADQSEQISQTVNDIFGDSLRRGREQIRIDLAGYESGEIAADQAELSSSMIDS